MCMNAAIYGPPLGDVPTLGRAAEESGDEEDADADAGVAVAGAVGLVANQADGLELATRRQGQLRHGSERGSIGLPY